MSFEKQTGPEEFDFYATDYDEALSQGLAVSGESKDFFAAGRVRWLAHCLDRLGARPQRLLDFGCGTGSSTPYLLDLNSTCEVTGVEVSAKSLDVARRQHGSNRAKFALTQEWQPRGEIDLAFCNGVFHHIPPDKRAACVDYVFKSLDSGGLFAFWENNPWNPGTRYVMSRIPFDRDAITLSPPEARRLLQKAGFEIVRVDSLFYFPRMLGWLRGVERWLAWLPLGAQYQVLCRKP
jgi:SAM-dependent methyltransferase